MFVRLTLRLRHSRRALSQQLCTSSRCFSQDAPNSSKAKPTPWTSSIVVDEDAADMFVGKVVEDHRKDAEHAEKEKEKPQWVKSEAQGAFYNVQNVRQLQEVGSVLGISYSLVLTLHNLRCCMCIRN
jgi:hypothetical protein